MEINTIIVEQLEWDGTIKSLTLKKNYELGDLYISFANEYEDERSGPFHFQDQRYESKFQEQFANCTKRKLGKDRFSTIDTGIQFQNSWHNIPTSNGRLTYYALYLPEFAFPEKIKFTDPRSPDREFRKSVMKDNDKKRFVIYLPCRSGYGVFNFDLTVQFRKDKVSFTQKQYFDDKLSDPYENAETWKYAFNENEAVKVERFFSEKSQKVTNNPWKSGSFYLFSFLLIAVFILLSIDRLGYWSIPALLIGSILSLSVVGAFQLRNDDRLNDKSFLELMGLTFKYLRLINQGNKQDSDSEDLN